MTGRTLRREARRRVRISRARRRKKCLRILMYKPPPRSPRARSFRARRSFVIRRSLAAGRVRHRGGVRRGSRGLAVHGLRRVLGRRRVLGLLPVLRLHRHRRGGLHGVLGLRAALDGVELLFSVARAAAHEGEDEQRDQARDGAAVLLVHEVAGLAVDLRRRREEEATSATTRPDSARNRARPDLVKNTPVAHGATVSDARERRDTHHDVLRPGRHGDRHMLLPRLHRGRCGGRVASSVGSVVLTSALQSTPGRGSIFRTRRVCGDACVPSWHVPALVSAAKISCVILCLFFYFSRSESSPRRARVHLLSAYEYISRPP